MHCLSKPKKNTLFYSSPSVKKLLNSLSLRTFLSLSQSLNSHPLPKLSQSLKLSSSHSYSPLTVDRLTVPSHRSPIVDRLTVPSRRSPHRPKPPIADRLIVLSRRSPHRPKPPIASPSQATDRRLPHRPKLPIASPSLSSLPTQLTDPPLLPTQLADIVLVCD